MKRYIILIVALAACMSLTAFASEDIQEPEIVQTEQTETETAASQVSDPESITNHEPPQEPEIAESVVQDEQTSIDSESEEISLEPPGVYEQFEVAYDDTESGELSEGTEPERLNDIYTLMITGFFAVVGSVAGLAFMNKWNVGV